MGQSDNWTERFGISQKDLAQAEAASDVRDPLRWCLMNGKVPDAEYIDWAMDQYQLPSVNGDFFTIPADQVFWNQVKNLYDWNPAFFPLADWQGILMIACLEPPKDFRFNKPHRFVLASARNLLLHWNNLNPKHVQASHDTNPVFTDSSYDSVEAPAGLAGISFDAPEPDSNASAAPPISFDMPEGFSMGASPAKERTAKGAAPESEMPEGISFDAPAGLSAISFNEDHTLSGTAELHDLSSLMPEGLGTPPEQKEAKVELKSEISLAKAPQPKMEVKAPQADDKTAVVRDESTIRTEEPKSTVSENTAIISNVDDRAVESAVNMNDLGGIAMTHVLKQFNGAMLFLFEGETLKPWKWSALLTSPKNKDCQTIETQTPSIFRIVLRTRLPYHGYVTPSPANNKFFEAYHGGTLPKHVTLVPIMRDKTWIGMMMGIANSEISYKQSLRYMERLSDEVADKIERLRKTKAA